MLGVGAAKRNTGKRLVLRDSDPLAVFILPTPQAQWTLNCQNCNRVFNHSEIAPPSRTLPRRTLAYRPEVPEGGLSAVCPYCHQPGLSERFELTLRPTDTVR